MKKIFMIILMLVMACVTYAGCNYEFKIKNSLPTKITVSVEKGYYVHLDGLGNSFDIEAYQDQIVRVVGNSRCNWHATDLILDISTEGYSSNKLRIHQNNGDGGDVSYETFFNDKKSEVKIYQTDLTEKYVVGYGYSGLFVGDTPTENWMSKISDTTDLSALVMPGSHDAGMSTLSSCSSPSSYVQTQYSDISGQLNAGSRYFDIRPSFSDSQNAWITYHRTGELGCNGQLILNYGGSAKNDDIMQQVYDFVRDNPTETVILKFSHPKFKKEEVIDSVGPLVNADNLFDDLFTFAEAHPSTFVSEWESLDMSNLRGRVIVVLANDVSNEVSSDRKNRKAFWTDNSFPIYDNYSDTTDLENMKKDQLQKLDSNGGLDKSGLFLLSWTLTPKITSLGSIESLAYKANNALFDTIDNEMTDKQPNIVYLDYIDPRVTSKIIDFSYKYSK